jgi:ATP-dependent RNA helicase DDX6/DHH1
LAYKRIIRLNRCRFFILDEADKLISPDFQPVIEDLLSYIPKKKRQVLLFSATYPESVSEFVKGFPNMKKVNLMSELNLKGLTQYYVYLKEKQKVKCVGLLFSKLRIKQIIIFCNSALRVELLAKKIIEMNMSCYYIHSKMSQGERNKGKFLIYSLQKL